MSRISMSKEEDARKWRENQDKIKESYLRYNRSEKGKARQRRWQEKIAKAHKAEDDGLAQR